MSHLSFVEIACIFYNRMVARTTIALTPRDCDHLCDYALACAARYWRLYNA